MSKYTKEQVRKKVEELSKKSPWNHFFDFSEGIKTFDVGCSDGYFSIMCAKKGMSHVKGVDPDALRIEKANFAKEVYDLKNVEFEVHDLYELPEDVEHDIVLGLGLLHRVPDLDGCIDKLAAIGKNIILEFKTLNQEGSTYKHHGGRSKTNKWNGLHCTPTKDYVINRMRSNGVGNHQIIDDVSSELNYKRTIILFSKEKT